MIKIKKAKLPTDGEKFEVEYIDHPSADKQPILVYKEFKDPVHPDLTKAFEALRLHYGVLTGFLVANEVDPEDVQESQVARFYVSGFSASKNPERPGVVLTGHVYRPDGKAVIINTPFEHLNLDVEAGYQHIDDFVEKIEAAGKEVIAYVVDGKRGVVAQELPFKQEDEPVTNIQIDHPQAAYDGEAPQPAQGVEDVAKLIVEETNSKVVAMGDKPLKKKAQTADNPAGEEAVAQ